MNLNKNEEKEQSIRPDMYLVGKIRCSCLIDYLNYEKKSSQSINIFHFNTVNKKTFNLNPKTWDSFSDGEMHERWINVVRL